MDDSILKVIANNINITILPIIIIPVTGLCCLVFYNRLAAINNLMHSVYKDLITLQTSSREEPERHKALMESLREEHDRLVKRSDMVRTTITCCFLGLIAFILSAISIMTTFYAPLMVIATLTLWVCGALLFAVGLFIGMLEIKSRALNIAAIETTVVQHWPSE